MAALTAFEYFELAQLEEDPDQAVIVGSMIEMADADYMEIRGRALGVDGTGNPVYPASAKRSQFEMVQYLLSGQVNDDGDLGYPKSIISTIPRFVRVL